MNKKLLVVLILVGVIILLFWKSEPRKVNRLPKEVIVQPGKKVSNPAPDFTLQDLNGNWSSLSEFKGKVVILDFWATWCPPCRAEIPHFIELYDDYKDKGLEIIGVSLDFNANKILGAFVEENSINYTILIGDRDVTDLYGGIMSIPTTFVIDRDGGIRKKYIGYKEKEVFEEDVKGLLLFPLTLPSPQRGEG